MKNRIRNSLVIVSSLITRFLVPRNSIRVIAMHEVPMEKKGEFKRKMIWLKSNFPNVVLTFDDGFNCFYTVIFPVLKELGIPATFFIPSGAIGLQGEKAHIFIKENLRRTSFLDDFLTEAELKEIADSKLITIGGHTTNHIDCGESRTEEEWVKEIVDDKKKLEEIIGKEITDFAFPFGAKTNTSSQAVEKISQAGYKRAFSIVPGFTSLGVINPKGHILQGNSDKFWVSRDSLTLTESDVVWSAWLSGGYDWVIKLKDKIK